MDLLMSNRRYIGCKKSILKDIFEVVAPFCKKKVVFADLFAGTGVVSLFMLQKGMDVIVNDILRSNYVAYQTWFGNGRFNARKIEKIVNDLNKINSQKLKANYFSRVYGGKYFSVNDAKKIGFIREKISSIELTERERYILLTSLMYAVDKIANTVGHFEHFLSSIPIDRDINLKLPKIEKFEGNASIYNTDANQLARKIVCDIAYIDPPYNARQYVNFYHVLENLIRWEKPNDFEGSSMKFKRNHLKSDYSRAKAPLVFQDLIDNLSAKIIVVSYSNTYSAKSSASNNKISEAQLFRTLSLKGKTTTKEIGYKFFNSGKSNLRDHKEILYVCEAKV